MNDAVGTLSEILGGFDYIDLSPVLERGIPRWPTHPPVVIDPTITHDHDGYFCQTLNMGEHSGAHVDSPAHVIPYMKEHTIDTYPVGSLCGPAVVYDLSSFDLQPGERVGANSLLDLEKRTGAAAGEGDVVLLNFGWQRYWRTDKEWKYYACNAPGLEEDAARLFFERKVRAVGSDTVACDTPVKDGEEYRSFGHFQYWLPNHIFIMEMLQNLSVLPARSYFLAFPLKIKGGSGSPIRPVALVPKAAGR